MGTCACKVDPTKYGVPYLNSVHSTMGVPNTKIGSAVRRWDLKIEGVLISGALA